MRPARLDDAAAIGLVHVESWRSTYAGLLPASYLADLDPAAQAGRWRQIVSGENRRSFVHVAEAEGEVVGFASGGREREGDALYTGELYAIYLLASHQRRSLGRALFAAVAARLRETGHSALLVWVLEENRPARAFYESLGGAHLRSARHEVGGLEVEEAAYGWLDLSPLLGSL